MGEGGREEGERARGGEGERGRGREGERDQGSEGTRETESELGGRGEGGGGGGKRERTKNRYTSLEHDAPRHFKRREHALTSEPVLN